MIEFNSISKTFKSVDGPVRAIQDVTFTIKQNEIFGIIGESGAGKSTLLRFVNMLEQPDEGSILVNGTEVLKISRHELRNYKKDISMIFQQYNLLGNKTVKDNILLPLKLHHYENPLDIDQMLEFVGLSHLKDRYPRQLSGGQKQRVGIARSLITRPKILLCDEPTSALDENSKREIIALLERASQAFDVTIVVVTHELDVVKRLCDRVAIIEDGKLIDIISIDKNNVSDASNLSYSELAKEVLLND